jgi:glycosyltransferase involved in cell wall biosynthesis
MRTAIDARGINLYKGTGIGTYTENVLKNILEIDKESYFHIYWAGDNYEDFMKHNTKIIMSSKKHHRFFEQYYFPDNLKNENIDVFHIPQNGIGISEYTTCKKIVTIHDLIPYMMPETVGKGYLSKFLRELPKVVELSDAIITVSEWSKKDILKFFPIDESKVHVTPLAADKKYMPLDREKCKVELKNKYNITKPFILYIGGFSPRKNVKALLIAFSQVFSKLKIEHQLVIVGATKDDGNYLSKMSSSLDVSSNIIFTGFVPEDDLPNLYNSCEAFVYPSLYEGFGLPPLEAMSCGTPVITSNISSIPEVVGDSGILIDPFSTVSLIEALELVLNDDKKKQELREKGLARASEYSWRKTAEQTLEVYKKVIEE